MSMMNKVNRILQIIEYIEVDKDCDFLTALRVLELANQLDEEDYDG